MIHNDLIHYETVPSANSQKPKRTFDVQYSFSLNQPLFSKANEHNQQMSNVRSFADQFVQHAIHTVLQQVRSSAHSRLSTF
jgi:hypothetical protein